MSIGSQSGGRGNTHRFLGEDRALREALHDEGVGVLSSARASQSKATHAKVVKDAHAEKEPLEIAGHLEDGAVRYFLAGRERRWWWLRGTMQ